MEEALERSQNKGLPYLSINQPWYGYELGRRMDEEREDAAKAIHSEYVDTGKKLQKDREYPCKRQVKEGTDGRSVHRVCGS
jgi:hypothetical protein